MEIIYTDCLVLYGLSEISSHAPVPDILLRRFQR